MPTDARAISTLLGLLMMRASIDQTRSAGTLAPAPASRAGSRKDALDWPPCPRVRFWQFSAHNFPGHVASPEGT
jgi:hypothetical protein